MRNGPHSTGRKELDGRWTEIEAGMREEDGDKSGIGARVSGSRGKKMSRLFCQVHSEAN